MYRQRNTREESLTVNLVANEYEVDGSKTYDNYFAGESEVVNNKNIRAIVKPEKGVVQFEIKLTAEDPRERKERQK